MLDGQLRLVLGDQDLVMKTGEAAEFDTRVPHWYGSLGDGQVEVLSLFGARENALQMRA